MNDLATRALGVGATFWCVFPARYGAVSFNPNREESSATETVGGRFHPFESPSGTPVPTKYLADHENGALAETLLRDSPGEREVSLAQLFEHRLARLALRRSLQLGDLTEASPSSVPGRLLRQGHEAYRPLRAIAATLHARCPRLDGLLWEGYQLGQPGMKCLVLFGDRVSPESDLETVETFELDRGIGLRTLRAAARSREFVLPKALALEGLSSGVERGRRQTGEHASSADVRQESVVDAPTEANSRADRRQGSADRRVGNPTSDQAERWRALYRAREYRELQFFYQPQVRLPERRVSGFEALIRWKTAHGDFRPPHEILALSEESGQQCALGEWVLRTVCLDAATWSNALSVAVNVSPTHFADEHLVESVRGALEHAHFPPERLEVEITESALTENRKVSLERLTALRALGVSVAIDNFGVGLSSLAEIARLPVSKLKIDRSFLHGEPAARSRAVVESIVKLGEGLGVEIAVDGVETPEQLARLKDVVKLCTVQGYHIGVPRAVTEVSPFLSRGSDPDES